MSVPDVDEERMLSTLSTRWATIPPARLAQTRSRLTSTLDVRGEGGQRRPLSSPGADRTPRLSQDCDASQAVDGGRPEGAARATRMPVEHLLDRLPDGLLPGRVRRHEQHVVQLGLGPTEEVADVDVHLAPGSVGRA